MEKQIEKDIVQSVLNRLIEEGILKGSGKVGGVNTDPSLPLNIGSGMGSDMAAGTDNPPVTLEAMDTIGVENPYNMEALKVMRKSSPARILMGRCGARQKTSSLLHFLADHAAAVDAVFKDVSDQCLTDNDLFKVQTVVSDRDEYLMKPDLGKRLSEEAKKTILENCEKGAQVQIIVADGLSSTSIDANIGDVLPALIQGLKTEGLSVGKPFFIKYGRVGVMDEVAPLLDCDVLVEFIGERPGLITAESMSAYMAYRPNKDTVEAQRTVISNIHRGGTPPAEAGAHLATVVKQIHHHKTAGVKLSDLLK